MVKYRLRIMNIEKLEAWLLGYIQKGYRLKTVRPNIGKYEFEAAEHKDFLPQVRIDFRTFKKSEDFQDYLQLFQDSGWKHIAGTKSAGMQYFERTSENATEDIFSDQESKAARYKRMSDFWLSLFLTYIPILIALRLTGVLDFGRILDVKALYYTPGLWDLTGIDFLRAFLFETPFALGRGFFGILFLALVLVYGYFAIQAKYWHHKGTAS